MNKMKKEINIGTYEYRELTDGNILYCNGIESSLSINNVILDNNLQGQELEVILRPKMEK
jgi:hypothetical protein